MPVIGYRNDALSYNPNRILIIHIIKEAPIKEAILWNILSTTG
jgi:hypothetical protein